MATSLLQVRVDDSLKNDAVSIFNNLGIDISTAVKIFLKRVVICNGLPFRMTLPREIYCAERGYRTLLESAKSRKKKDFLKCRWTKLMLRLKLSENNDILRNSGHKCSGFIHAKS